jgi:hypothetical protein
MSGARIGGTHAQIQRRGSGFSCSESSGGVTTAISSFGSFGGNDADQEDNVEDEEDDRINQLNDFDEDEEKAICKFKKSHFMIIYNTPHFFGV